MICLNNTDTLEGGASVNAVVDYTVHGLVGSTFTRLASGQLSNTDPSVLYTAAAAISIVSITLVNTHTAAVMVNLYLDPANAGTPRRMIPKNVSLGVGYALVYDGQRFSVMNAIGEILQAANLHAALHQNGGSDEILVTGLSGLLADDQHVLDAEVLAILEQYLPWIIDIDVFTTSTAKLNWDTIGINAAAVHNGYKQSSGAQNDYIAWSVILSAGTWTVELIFNWEAAQGIYSIQFDSVEKGTIDAYAGALVWNARSTVTGIVVPTTKKIEVKLKMASKNALSSNYYGTIMGVRLIRTA